MVKDTNKEFLALLNKHYELIRSMAMEPRPFESRSDIMLFISDHSVDNVQANSLFERFINCGILTKSYSFWTIPSYITLFIRKREGVNSFTSSESVNGFIKDLRNGTIELEQLCLEDISCSVSEVTEVLQVIEDAFCQISAASQNNCSKISEEVEEFQLMHDIEFSDSKIRHFHRLCKRYIDPMLAIIVDPNCELEQLSDELVKLCDKASRIFVHHEYIVEYSNNLKHRIRVSFRHIADKVRQARNELEVIFEVYSKHSRIMKGVGALWELLQDEQKLNSFSNEYLLGADISLKSSQPNSDSYRRYLEDAFLGETQHRTPPKININSAASRQGTEALAFYDIVDALKLEENIDDVMIWLFDHYQGNTLSYYIETLFDIEKQLKLTVTEDLCTYQSPNDLIFELNRREYTNGL